MRLGLAVAFTDPGQLLTWARRADALPYHRFGLNDRIVYHNPEPMVMLGALAAVTERIRIQTEVLIAPVRDPVLLAKEPRLIGQVNVALGPESTV